MTAAARARPVALALVAFAAAALGVSRFQVKLASELHAIKDTDDVYPFPPPPILRLATLGYVAATTDVLWGKLLVEHGSHWVEHRPFGDLEHYLDALIELDPTFLPFYDYVDTLLGYRPMGGHELDAREARAYLERGTKTLPNDASVWLKYGQFVAFMGPTYLTSDDEKTQWKKDGALAIEHAVSLGADVDFGIAASSLLGNRLGQRRAQVEFLRKAYALAENDATRAEIAARLAMLNDEASIDCARDAIQAIEVRRRADYPFLDYATYILLAPTLSAAGCVGPGSSFDPRCARDWNHALPACDSP